MEPAVEVLAREAAAAEREQEGHAADDGGSTIGRFASARTIDLPGNSTRASSQAIGSPNSTERPVAEIEDSSDNRGAVRGRAR